MGLPTNTFKEVKIFDQLVGSTVDARLLVEPPATFRHAEPTAVSYFSPNAATKAITNPDAWWNESCAIPPLYIYKLHNAIVVPGLIKTRCDGFHTDGQVILTSEGKIFTESFCIMDGENTLPTELANGADGLEFPSLNYVPGNFFFLGSLHRHFGHMLLEGLARLWPLCDQLFHSLPRDYICYEGGIPKVGQGLLKPFNIEGRIRALDGPSRVEELYVATNSYRSHRWAHRRQRDVWDFIRNYYASEDVSTKTKLYISRAKASDRKLSNEKDVERIFANEGFSIIHPEELDFGKQVALVAGCEVLAGCVGSGLYLRAFSRRCKDTKVMAPRNFFLKDDALIANLCGGKLSVAFGSVVDNSSPRDQRDWTIEEKVAHNLAES